MVGWREEEEIEADQSTQNLSILSASEDSRMLWEAKPTILAMQELYEGL
jgi:hypothetical protein